MSGRFYDENRQIGGDVSIRIHGTRVRHCLSPASIKMYDKHGHNWLDSKLRKVKAPFDLNDNGFADVAD